MKTAVTMYRIKKNRLSIRCPNSVTDGPGNHQLNDGEINEKTIAAIGEKIKNAHQNLRTVKLQ